MKNFVWQCLTVVLVGLMGLAAGAPSDSPAALADDSTDMGERVRAVVLQNKAARQGIKS